MGPPFELVLGVDDPLAGRAARHTAAEVIQRWDVRPALVDDSCLVVSELVTNALVHGRSDVLLRLLKTDDRLRIEVFDDNTRLPAMVPPDPHSLSGRGLFLIAALVSTWGTERTPDGKVVWAEFDLTDRRSG